MNRTKLLDRRPTSHTTGGVLVRSDVFIHNLDPLTLDALRRALELGLVPTSLDLGGDDNSIAIIRFSRTPEVEREQRK
jgi:hypothetical protein